MALNLSSLVENAMGLPMQPQQMVGNHHSRGKRGGARSQAFSNWNIVFDLDSNLRQRLADILGNRERGLPDEVVFAGRNLRSIAAGGADRQLICALEPASQINGKRK